MLYGKIKPIETFKKWLWNRIGGEEKVITQDARTKQRIYSGFFTFVFSKVSLFWLFLSVEFMFSPLFCFYLENECKWITESIVFFLSFKCTLAGTVYKTETSTHRRTERIVLAFRMNRRWTKLVWCVCLAFVCGCVRSLCMHMPFNKFIEIIIEKEPLGIDFKLISVGKINRSMHTMKNHQKRTSWRNKKDFVVCACICVRFRHSESFMHTIQFSISNVDKA